MSNDQPAQPTAVQQPPAPYGPPQAYPPNPYPYAAVPPTNTLAIVALVLAFFVSIAGIVCGYIALGQIKRTGEGGHGLALAAVIVGWVYTGATVIFLIVYFVIIFTVFGALATHSVYSGN